MLGGLLVQDRSEDMKVILARGWFETESSVQFVF